MEPCDAADPKPRISAEDPVVASGGLGDLAWAIVKLRAGERLTLDEPLIAAFQAASSPHTLRALQSDLEAFDLWCRRTGRITLPATPEVVADYLDARAGKGSKPASLSRYKASIARLHKLLGIADPTAAPLVRLRLAAINKAKGVAQAQARPLRFKGPVRDVAGDAPRGLNIRALIDSCPDDLPGLRDRALLSTAYDTGLRASELCAVAIEHLAERSIPRLGCCGF